jgi:hypothetical protein
VSSQIVEIEAKGLYRGVVHIIQYAARPSELEFQVTVTASGSVAWASLTEEQLIYLYERIGQVIVEEIVPDEL